MNKCKKHLISGASLLIPDGNNMEPTIPVTAAAREVLRSRIISSEILVSNSFCYKFVPNAERVFKYS